MTPRPINQAGVDLIKSFEGLRCDAYPDPGTGAAPFTVGYGHTGPEVHLGLCITPEYAEALLRGDLVKFEAGVASGMDDATDNQFAACVSLAFNIGLRNFLGSTVLREHNAGNFGAAANGFRLWDKANHKPMAGLLRRRNAEADLYRRTP